MVKRFEELNRQWLEIYWAFHQFEDVNKDLLKLIPALSDLQSADGFSVTGIVLGSSS